MGWTTFAWPTAQAVIDELSRQLKRPDSQHELVADRKIGREYWRLVRNKQTQELSLYLDLIQCFGKGEYGYKDISLDAWPSYYKAPKKMVAQLPMSYFESNEQRQNWYTAWLNNQSNTKPPLQVGQRFINNGWAFEIVERHPTKKNSWMVKRLSDGQVFVGSTRVIRSGMYKEVKQA